MTCNQSDVVGGTQSLQHVLGLLWGLPPPEILQREGPDEMLNHLLTLRPASCRGNSLQLLVSTIVLQSLFILSGSARSSSASVRAGTWMSVGFNASKVCVFLGLKHTGGYRAEERESLTESAQPERYFGMF